MSGRAFLFVFLVLSVMVILTSPPVSGTLVNVKVTPPVTLLPPTVTSIATPTADPFGHLPTATLPGGGGRSVPKGGYALARSLPTQNLRHVCSKGFYCHPTAMLCCALPIMAAAITHLARSVHSHALAITFQSAGYAFMLAVT
jgi:hypothetical protein